MLGLRAIDSCSVVGSSSSACLVLPGALRVCLARYFTTPSRLQGLDIDRAITLTGTSRILDEAKAGQSVRMPAKLCPAWLSAIQLLVAPDKSVKTCQEFRQGWSRILEAFTWFDPGPLVKQMTLAALPDSGRGSYPVAYQICRQPAHALVPGRTWMIRGLHICPEPVQNPSGVCQGYETEKPLPLTASARGKLQTATLAESVLCLSHIRQRFGKGRVKVCGA